MAEFGEEGFYPVVEADGGNGWGVAGEEGAEDGHDDGRSGLAQQGQGGLRIGVLDARQFRADVAHVDPPPYSLPAYG